MGHAPSAIPPASQASAQLVLLVAAEMPDDEAAGPLGRGDRAEAARHRAADHVLHAHRLARAKERAVEDGVRDGRLRALRRGQPEAPALDALIPARVHEGQVVAALRGDEESAVELPEPLVEAVVLGATWRDPCAREAPRRAPGPGRRCGRSRAPCPRSRGRRRARPRRAGRCRARSPRRATPPAPHLKCTPRFVTRAAAGTYIGCGLPSKAAPSRGLASSTT